MEATKRPPPPPPPPPKMEGARNQGEQAGSGSPPAPPPPPPVAQGSSAAESRPAPPPPPPAQPPAAQAGSGALSPPLPHALPGVLPASPAAPAVPASPAVPAVPAAQAAPPPPPQTPPPPRTTAASEPTSEIVPVVAPAPGASKTSRIAEAGAENESATHATVNDHDHDSIRLAPALEDRLSGINNTAAGAPGGITRSGNSNVGSVAAEGAAAKAESPAQMTETVTVPPPVAGTHSGAFEAIASSRRESAREKVMRDPIVAIYEDEPAEINRLLNIQTSSTEQSSHAARQSQKAKASASYRSQQKVRKNVQSKLEDIGVAFKNIFETAGEKADDLTSKVKGGEGGELSRKLQGKEAEELGVLPDPVDTEKKVDLIGTEIDDVTAQIEAERLKGANVVDSPLNTPWLLMGAPVAPLGIMYTWTVMSFVLPPLYAVGVWVLFLLPWRVWLMLFFGAMVGVLASWGALRDSALRPVILQVDRAFLELQDKIHEQWKKHEDDIMRVVNEKFFRDVYPLLVKLDDLFKSKAGYSLLRAFVAKRKGLRHDELVAEVLPFEDRKDEEEYDEYENYFLVSIAFESLRDIWNPKFKSVWIDWVVDDMVVETLAPRDLELFPKGDKGIHYGTANMNPDDNTFRITQEVRMSYFPARELPNLQDNYNDTCITLRLMGRKVLPLYSSDGKTRFLKDDEARGDHAICIGHANISAKRLGCGMTRQRGKMIYSDARIPFFVEGFEDYHCAVAFVKTSVTVVHHSSYSYRERVSSLPSGDWSLRIHIFEMRALSAADDTGSSDPYVEVEAFKTTKTTNMFRQTLSCVVDEMLVFNQALTGPELEEAKAKLSVFDWNFMSSPQLIGQIFFDVSNIYRLPNQEIYRQWFAVYHPEKGSKAQGYLKLSVSVLSPGGSIPVLHAEYEDREEFSTAVLLKNQVVKAPTFAVKSFVVHVTVGWADMIARMANDFTSRDVVRGFLMVEITGFAQLISQTFIGAPRPIADELLGDACRVDVNRAIIVNEEFLLPLSVINGAITVDAVRIKLMHRTQSSVTENKLVGEVDLHMQELLEGRFEAVVRGNPDDGETPGDRIETVAMLEPRWYNFYGNQYGMLDTEAKQVAFRGRLLVGAAAKSGSVRKPFSRPCAPPTRPRTALYSFELQISRATELPLVGKLVGVQAKLGIYEFGHKFPRVPVRNKCCDWDENSLLRATFLQFPEDIDQVPDLFVTLLKRDDNGEPAGGSNSAGKEGGAASGASLRAGGGFGAGAGGGGIGLISESGGESGEGADGEWTVFAYLRIPVAHMILKQPEPKWMFMDFPGDSVGNEGSVPGSLLINAQMSRMDISIEEYVEYKRAQQEEVDATITGSTVGTAVAGSNPAVGDMAGTVGPQVQVGTANMPPPSAAAPSANGTGTSSSEKTQSAIVSAAVVAAGMAAGTEDAASTVATAGPTPGSTGLTLEDDADEAARLAAASKLAREMRLASIRQRIDAVERTGYFTPRLGVEKYYTLRALVLKGRDLPAADASGLSDPLFTISVGNRTVDWKIYCEQTKNPVWDAFIVVKNIMVREGQRFPNVNVMVKDYNEDLNFDYLGRAMINISDIEEDPVDFRTARWYPVFSASPEYQNGEILADFQLQAQLGLEEEEIQEQEPPQQEVAQSPNDRQAESGNLYQSLDTKLAARVGGECELPRRTNRYLRLSVLGVEDLRFLRPAAGKVHLEMTVTREEPMPQVTRSGNLLLDREFEANVSILDVVFLRVGMPEQGRRYAESLNVFCKGTFPYMKPGNDSHLIGTTSIDLAGYVPMLRRQEKTYKDLAMDKYGMDDPVPRYLVQKYHYFARISVEDIPHAVFSRELNFNARVDRNHGLEDEEDDIPEENVDRLLNHFSRSASRISQLDTSAENEALNNASSGGKETNVMGTPPVVSGAAKKAPWLRVGYHEEILTEKQKKMIELSKKLAEMQKQMAIVMAQVRASLYNVNDAISSAMPDVALKLGLPESHEEPLLMAKKLEEEELAVSSESTALLRRERGFCPDDLEFDLPGSIFGELALTRGDTRSLGAITGDALRAKHVDVKDEVAEGVGERELIIQEKRLALLEGKRPVIGKAKLRMDLVNLDEDPEGGLKGVTDEKLRLEMARLSSFRSFGRALRPTEVVVRVYVLRALNLEQTHNVCNPYLVAKFFGGYPNKYSMKYSPVLNTDNPTFFTMFESRVMLPSAQIRLEVKDRVLPKTEISIQYPWFVRGPSGSKFGLAKSEVPLDAGYFGLGWSELIGDTEIDLDQRWYNPQWRNLKITPIEARSLWRAGNVNLKGKLELFIDMIAARDYDARPHSFLPFKLPAPEKKKFLMRVVIFKVMDAYLPYIRSDNPNYMSNLYVACKVGNESSGFRKTDLCRFVVDGKGQWNWRMSWWLELPDTELKPRLKVQVFDNTGFGLGSDDLCASGDVKLRTLFDELLQSNELTLKKRQWVILSHPSYPQIDTRVELAIEVLPESQVGLKKCGYGTDSWKLNQDEDYILPYPFRPVPFSLTNPAPFFNYQIMSLVNNLQWQLATYLLPFPFLPMILQLAWMTPWWWYGMGGVAGLIVFLRVFLLDMARYERMRAEEKKQAAEAEAQVGEVKITKDVDEQGS